MKELFVGVVWAVVLLRCGAAPAAESDAFPIGADAELQRRLDDLVRSADADEAGEEGHFRKLAQLTAAAKANKRHFVQQVVHYTYYMEDKLLAPAVYRLFIWVQVDAGELAESLAPYLYCPHAGLRTHVRRLFPFALLHDRRTCTDYSSMRHLVSGSYQRPEISVPLKRMMFEFDPNAAFLLLHTESKEAMIEMRRHERTIANALYQKRQLGGLDGGKIDGNTADAIRTLSESKYWWARLFSAEIMAQNKEFRITSAIERLLQDEDVLVQESVKSIKSSDPMRAIPADK